MKRGLPKVDVEGLESFIPEDEIFAWLEKTTETVCGITDLPPGEADEHRLLALNRGHWSIENKLHLPRITSYNVCYTKLLRNVWFGLRRRTAESFS